MNNKNVVSVCVICCFVILAISQACRPNQTVQTSLDLAGYSLALDDCKALGKDAGSYAVYESCAQLADVKYGRKDGGK